MNKNGEDKVIYFEQAASSFPKPNEVIEAMVKTMNECGANPGRGSHKLARQANETIDSARNLIAKWIGCRDPKHILFFSNATTALNQAIKGLKWAEGDHVITTSLEHNSVRRPLEFIKQHYGIHISYVKGQSDQESFIKKFESSITDRTRLIVITHASNVTGEVLPLDALIQVAKRNNIMILLDASQTIGHIEINMEQHNIDMVAFPGHKGALGPQGIGVLAIRQKIDLTPLHHGGTGFLSHMIEQPDTWPERYES